MFLPKMVMRTLVFCSAPESATPRSLAATGCELVVMLEDLATF